MEENKKENKRKAKKQARKNSVFSKMRKHFNEKYDKKIKQKEKKLGRPLTNAEKKKIADNIANGVLIQLLATGASLVAVFSVGNKIISQPALPEPEKVSTVETVKPEETTKDATKDFREEMKVEIPETEDPETEIDEIDSKEDTLRWLKDVYVDKYEEITGKENLSAYSIEILDKKVPAMYKTSDGQYITTIESPLAAEGILNQNGISYEEISGSSVYMVSIANNGTVIDCATKGVDGYHDVTIAEYYDEMKDSNNSVLAELGDITPKTFELMDLYSQLEEKPGNEFIENIISSTKENLKEKYKEVFTENSQENAQENQTNESQTQDQDGFEVGD